jgi:hypothetical protein
MTKIARLIVMNRFRRNDRENAPLPYRPCEKLQQDGSQSRPKIVPLSAETAFPSINLLNIAAHK